MNNQNEFRTGRHCVFAMHVHLVFVTKYRKNIFEKQHLDYMKTLFEKLCKNFESELVEFDGEFDHVHLLVNYPPKVCVSKLVNTLKGTSSKMLKEKFPNLKQHYWQNALWSPSYFAGSCGGASLSLIRQYVEQQNTPVNCAPCIPPPQ